ncbi:MAG: hypothetical protein ACLQGP_36715 [Isosphaeraceae bacterium]
MARDLAKDELNDLAGIVGSLARDAERLVGQHVALLRSELGQGARETRRRWRRSVRGPGWSPPVRDWAR